MMERTVKAHVCSVCDADMVRALCMQKPWVSTISARSVNKERNERLAAHGEVNSIERGSPGKSRATRSTRYPASSKRIAVDRPMTPTERGGGTERAPGE